MNSDTEKIVKVVRRLAFDLRNHMTSVTRYVRHSKGKTETAAHFKDRHAEYQRLAEIAVGKILEALNQNEELREIEKMGITDGRYSMETDKNFHNAYNQRANYTPTATPLYCKKCSTRLKVYYAEDRLYAVKCGFCETVTLVKADNPTEAARYVGEYNREDTVI